MAMIVKIFINETQIVERHCVRIQGGPHEWCTYMTDDGRIIRHHYDRGAEALTRKLLMVAVPVAAPPSR